jgi:hypothetical protein
MKKEELLAVAEQDCTEKSCFAAARLSDVVRTGLKDD